MRAVLLALASIGFSACTSIAVKPLSTKIEHVCIQNNPKVVVTDFVSVMQDGFTRHGITSEVFDGAAKPANCEFVTTYSARRNWDLAPYLTDADVHLMRDNAEIASAEFHLKGKGGLALNKWRGTKSKMDPVMDQLLAASR